MARSPARRPPSEQPVSPAAPSVALASKVGSDRHLHPTAAEDEERRQLIESLFLAGAPTSQIIRIACSPPKFDEHGVKVGGGFSLKLHQVKHYLAELRHQHALFYAESEKSKRTDQVARLRNDTMRMRSEKRIPYSALQATEKLIAEIEGNLAPRRLQLELHAVPDALAAAIAGMSSADVERGIAEELERAKKLAAIEATGSAAE